MRARVVAAILFASGCAAPGDSPEPTPTPAPTPTPRPAPTPAPAPPPTAALATLTLPAPPPPTAFVDVTEAAGIDAPHHELPGPDAGGWMSGQAWGDFNGDGLLDLVTTHQQGESQVFFGDGGGEFVASDLREFSDLPALGATAVDVDDDGDLDLYLSGVGGGELAINDGAGNFGRAAPGVDHTQRPRDVASAWADYDQDGILDLYTARYICLDCDELGETDAERSADALWQGRGGLEFKTADHLLGDPILRSGVAMQPAWFDYDDDGDLDLLVVNDRGAPGPQTPGDFLRRNALWRNDGPGCGEHCFTEVAQEVGVDVRIDGMCAGIGDYDNDGDLDLFMTDVERSYLLQNLGGQFVDVTVAAGVERPMVGWGCSWLDFDNDGWLDLYVAGGLDDPDVLFRNRGDGTFASWIEHVIPQETESRGVAAGDYDGDGRVDLVVALEAESYRLLRNRWPTDNHWLGLRLIGSGAGGRSALGARAYVTTDDGAVQMRDVRSGSSLGSGDDLGLHFGLGDRAVTDLTIQWPDGTEESFDPTVDAWTTLARGSR